MPLVMNGVIIPENVANAFYFNGVNITDVFMNGVQVWNQSLFSATWSGSSYGTGNGEYGFLTSGSLFKARDSLNGDGPWVTPASSSGFNNVISQGASAAFGSSVGFIFYSDETLRMRHQNGTVGTPVSYSIGTGFAGAGSAVYYVALETSSGLIRINQKSGTSYGAWVSLT